MRWHIIVRIGSHNTYSPTLSPDEPRLYVSIDAPGDSFAIKNNLLAEVCELRELDSKSFTH